MYTRGIHISRTVNKMGVNIESQNDGRGSIDRIAFREDSSVQKRIFVSIRFEFFSFFFFFPPFLFIEAFVSIGLCGGLRIATVRFVLFEKLMDDVIYLRFFIYLFFFFFAWLFFYDMK